MGINNILLFIILGIIVIKSLIWKGMTTIY